MGISPEQLRKALADMFRDPETRRLILTGSLPIQGGTCTSPKDVGPGDAFGANCSGGDYSFPAKLGIGITNPGWPLDVNGIARVQGEWLLLLDGSGIGWYNTQSYIKGKAAGDATDYLAFGTRGTSPGERMRIDSVGNVGIGSMNKIIFLTAAEHNAGTTGRTIQVAIDALAAASPPGGIIMLTPGTYNIASTVTVTSDGIKLRGYGGTWEGDDPAAADTTAPVTLLKWTGSAGGGPVVLLSSLDDDDFIQDLEISDLTIDGNRNSSEGTQGSTGAAMGLKLNQVMDSRFVAVNVKNLKVRASGGTGPSTGILLTTVATADGVGTSWNLFENCTVVGASIGIELTQDSSALVNSCHNRFVGLNVRSYGAHADDVGIWLVECDNNGFYETWIQMDSATGYGVVVNDPTLAYSNYFYHLQPGEGLRIKATSGDPSIPSKNFVFGYDQANGQDAPSTDSANPPSDFLAWTNSAGEMHGVTVVTP